MDFGDRLNDPYGPRLDSIERQLDALHTAVQVPVTGASIDVPGLEATPFTEAVVKSFALLNNQAGDQLVRADAAMNGVSTVINGLRLLELNQQQLMRHIANLEERVAKLDGEKPERTGGAW